MSEILTPLERKGKYIVGRMTSESAKTIAAQINRLLENGTKEIQLALFFDDGRLLLSDDLFAVRFIPN